MRKLLAAALVAPLLIAGTVAAEGDAPEACGDKNQPVVAAGETFTFESAGADSVSFYLDAASSEKGRVSTTVTLTWDLPINDYDLDVNGETSINLQPVDDTTESVSVSATRCQLVTASWDAFLVAGPDSLVLTADVR